MIGFIFAFIAMSSSHQENVMKLSKYLPIVLAGVLPLFYLIFAIGCQSEISSDNGGILYWSANNPYEQEVARQVVAEWNQLHPETPVVHQPVPEGQSSEEVILAAIAAKTTPDIYSNVWPGDVEFYVRAQSVVCLSDIPGAEESLLQRCGLEAIEESRARDGRLYQVPWKVNPIMMLYNKKMLQEIGYDQPPATYTEFLDAAEKLQARNIGGKRRWIGIADIRNLWLQRLFDFYALYLAASNGKTLVRQDSILFENNAALQVFQFLQEVYRNGYFPMERTSGTGDPFLLGKLASKFTGPWEITHTERFKSEGFEYGFAPLPVPDKSENPAYTYGDPKNIVIFTTCNNPKAAWEFVQFMISRKNDLLLLEKASQLPRRPAMLEDEIFQPYFDKNPLLAEFAQQAKYVRGIDQAPVMKEVFDAISQEYEAAVVYGAKSAEKAIADAAKRVRLILE